MADLPFASFYAAFLFFFFDPLLFIHLHVREASLLELASGEDVSHEMGRR